AGTEESARGEAVLCLELGEPNTPVALRSGNGPQKFLGLHFAFFNLSSSSPPARRVGAPYLVGPASRAGRRPPPRSARGTYAPRPHPAPAPGPRLGHCFPPLPRGTIDPSCRPGSTAARALRLYLRGLSRRLPRRRPARRAVVRGAVWPCRSRPAAPNA